jgi:hypothetical protein
MSERSEFSPVPETSAERREPADAQLWRARHRGCPFLPTFLGKQKSRAGCGGAAPARIFSLTVALLFLAQTAAHSDELRLGGYAKSLNLYAEAPPASGIPSGKISANRLRLDLTGEAAEKLDIELSLENLLLYTDPAGLIPLPRAPVNRRFDLEKNRNEGGRFQNQLFVDRLNLRTERLGVQWTIGRQAIGFGRITIFSPLDVIAPFPPDALDTDVRPGVDALHGVRYFGLGGQIGGVAVFGDGPVNNSYLATFSLNVQGIDLLALAGSLRERPVAGFGLAGSLGGLGLKGEIAAYKGRDVGEAGGDRCETFAIAAVETWYRFDSGVVLLTEYLYNGVGTGSPQDYPQALAAAPFAEGLSFLLGRHYLLAGPAYEVHPLLKVNGLLIWNLEDDSFLLRPLLDFSLADNLALQVFWSFSEGRKPRKVFGLPVPRSEFGATGDSGGLLLKHFF